MIAGALFTMQLSKVCMLTPCGMLHMVAMCYAKIVDTFQLIDTFYAFV